jgi:WD40 repeat protein
VIRLWDVRTGRLLRELVGHRGAAHALAFPPTGTDSLLSDGFDGALTLWDVRTGLPSRRHRFGGVTTTEGISYSPRGDTVAVVHPDAPVTLHDAATLAQLRKWVPPRGNVVAGDFALTGRNYLGATDRKTLCLWDVTTGKLLREWKASEEPLKCLAVSPDLKMAAVGAQRREITLWDLQTGRVQARTESRVHLTRGTVESPCRQSTSIDPVSSPRKIPQTAR